MKDPEPVMLLWSSVSGGCTDVSQIRIIEKFISVTQLTEGDTLDY